jgi:transposase
MLPTRRHGRRFFLLKSTPTAFRTKKMSLKRDASSGKNQAVRYTKNLEVVNPHCAGLDIHKEKIWVCTSPFRDGVAPEVSTFATDTGSLEKLAAHLQEKKITTVALESTGNYWLPAFLTLRRAKLNPILVNPRDVKNIKGRPKSDRADCVWICRLHSYGFLRASFVPPDEVLDLRSLYYAHEKLTVDSAGLIQRMNDELVKMNIRIDLILTDLSGASGIRLIEAILQGERSPERLYQLLDRRITKKGRDAILPHLHGHYREGNLSILRIWHRLYLEVREEISRINQHIYDLLQRLPKKADAKDLPRAQKGYREDHLDFPYKLRPIFFEIYGVDLTQLPGIGAGTLLAMVCMVGADLSPWPSAKHFVSWLGLAPINQESAGYRKSGSTQRINHLLGNAFKIAAMAAKRSTTYIGRAARRLSARILPKKARVATARKLAELVYNILQNGMELKVKTEEEYEQRRKQRDIRSFVKGLFKYIVNGELIPEVEEVYQEHLQHLQSLQGTEAASLTNA